MHHRCVQDPPRDHELPDHRVLRVEDEDVELLLLEVAHQRCAALVDVARTTDPVPLHRPPPGETPADLERTPAPRRHRRAAPPDPLPLPRAPPPPPPPPAAGALEHPPRNRH